jgi:secreted trypsin-like serine protease
VRRRTISVLAAAVLVPALGAGLALSGGGTADAIAGGEPVAEGRYAFSVKLTMTGIPTADGGRRNSACSGALIAPQWIITAGHCFRDADGVRVDRPVADSTVATVGRTDLTNTGAGVDAKVIRVRQSPTADVAIAKLDKVVRRIEPIRIARSAPAEGTVLRLTGYGSLTSVNPAPVTRLQTGQMSVVEVADAVIGVTGEAPNRDTTPCPYDSGGPFFTEQQSGPVLVSVVSNGPSCPHAGTENSARVDNLRQWINRSMRGSV